MAIKRCLDIICAMALMLVLWPFLLAGALLVFLYDFKFPFYISDRVGLNFVPFKMYKIRTMIIYADKDKIDTTKEGDIRITPVGKFIRKYKIDEIPQLFNVIKGDMSLVGPRPNVQREVDLYTDLEKKLLTVKPGITDFASIAFSDLGALLKNYEDANIAYNQLVRPWKSRLGIMYVHNMSFCLDLKILCLTMFAVVSNKNGKKLMCKTLSRLDIDDELIKIVVGEKALYPYPPPGTDEIVLSRC